MTNNDSRDQLKLVDVLETFETLETSDATEARNRHLVLQEWEHSSKGDEK